MKPFLTGVVAGYGIAVPVGAIGILIIETGMRRGFRKGFAAGAGAATADVVYAAAAVIGGAGIVAAVGSVGPFLRLGGGVLLAAMAVVGLWRTLRDRPAAKKVRPEGGMLGVYAAFLGLTLVNPATVVYFAAVVVGLGVASGMTLLEGAAFVLGAGLASLSWQTLLAWFGSAARGRVSEATRRLIGVVGNLVVAGLAIAIFLG